jgi:hypothetical protein
MTTQYSTEILHRELREQEEQLAKMIADREKVLAEAERARAELGEQERIIDDLRQAIELIAPRATAQAEAMVTMARGYQMRGD